LVSSSAPLGRNGPVASILNRCRVLAGPVSLFPLQRLPAQLDEQWQRLENDVSLTA
jgi:hypothetical protein